MTLQQQLAEYVRALEDGSKATHCAEDGALYEKYLADAAGLLAAACAGRPADEVRSRFSEHNRLWGYTWLKDPEYKAAAELWAKIHSQYQAGAI